MKRITTTKILSTGLLFIFVAVCLPISAVEDFSVDSVLLCVYRDGLVHVNQFISVNETVPFLSFPLINSEIGNIIVLDENSSVLDYDMEDSNITVYSLGAKKYLPQII